MIPGAAPAGAHVVYGRSSLALLVGSADVVARARIEDTSGFVDAGPTGRRPVVSARSLEVVKGEVSESALRFVQHGHGAAVFEPGEEVWLFLLAIEKSRELAALAGRDGLRWVSLQEHDAKLAAAGAAGAELDRAVRDYAALGRLTDAAERLAAWHSLTLRLLRSNDARLSGWALSDLAVGGGDLVTAETLAELEPLVDDPDVRIGVRLGVLAELERRRLLEAPERWAGLLRTVEPPDLLAVVRAAAAHPSPPVNRELVRLLAAGEAGIAQAAALSLGVPGNREAVEPLARLLREGEPQSRMMAIRALGRIALPEAVAVLEDASRSHPDEPTRRRAGAELRRLDRGGA